MWHWNSLWTPPPGTPPALNDPSLWRMPWNAEQALALQARTWEAMLSAGHSWWNMVLSAWAVPTLPAVGQLTPVHEASERPAPEPQVDLAAATRKPAPARKRGGRQARPS